STAEAISVLTGGLALAAHFGDGVLRPHDVAAGIVGAVVKDPVADRAVWVEYLETVVREREGWADFYRAGLDVTGSPPACSGSATTGRARRGRSTASSPRSARRSC